MRDESLATASTEVLEHEAVTLAAEIAAATCRWLLVIAELDRRESWGSWWGCKSMAHWLSWRCSLSRTTAREQVRVARALHQLPRTTAAFEQGRLSYSKVRALTRVATPENEVDLVELASTATAAQLDTIVRASVVAATDPDRRDAMQELHFGTDSEGFCTTRVRLLPERHAIVDAAVAKATEGASAEAPAALRRADAFVKICESYLATGDRARAGVDRVGVVIHAEIDAETGVIEHATTDDRMPVHPETASRLACDAALFTIVHGRLEPLGSGRTTRTPSRALRRAIARRSHGRCEWAGCDERTYVEIHHIEPWARGGATEWWNLVALCWHHHHLVHEGGWRVELERPTGRIRCYRPDGTELHDPTPIDIAPLPRTIDDERIVPLWCGERFDLSACVDAVLTAGPR